MSRFLGDTNKVLFKYESGTYNTASGNGQWIGLVTSHELVTSENVTPLRYVGGGTRNPDVFVDGARDHVGTITYHPQDWKFLGFALGSTVDTGSPSPYAHNLNEANSTNGNAFTSGTLLPFFSFTIEDSQSGATAGTNLVRTAIGCVVNSFELSASQGEITECTVEYVAQSVNYSSGATTAVTAATTRPHLWSDVKVHIPSGTVIDEVTDMTFSVNNNLNPPHYLNGSRDIAPPIPENREVMLNLSVHGTSERSKTFYDNYFRGGSLFNVFLEVTDASAGAGSRSLFVSLSGCRMLEHSAPTPNEGVNTQEIVIQAGSCNAIVADLIQLYSPW